MEYSPVSPSSICLAGWYGFFPECNVALLWLIERYQMQLEIDAFLFQWKKFYVNKPKDKDFNPRVWGLIYKINPIVHSTRAQ